MVSRRALAHPTPRLGSLEIHILKALTSPDLSGVRDCSPKGVVRYGLPRLRWASRRYRQTLRSLIDGDSDHTVSRDTIDSSVWPAGALSTGSARQARAEDEFLTFLDEDVESEPGISVELSRSAASPLFYLQACVDLDRLYTCLSRTGTTAECRAKSMHALLSHIVSGAPTSAPVGDGAVFVLVCARSGDGVDLSEAFLSPVRSDGRGEARESIRALASFWDATNKMYGTDDIAYVWCASALADDIPSRNLQECRLVSAGDVIGSAAGYVQDVFERHNEATPALPEPAMTA